jgi:hypothetical protein
MCNSSATWPQHAFAVLCDLAGEPHYRAVPNRTSVFPFGQRPKLSACEHSFNCLQFGLAREYKQPVTEMQSRTAARNDVSAIPINQENECVRRQGKVDYTPVTNWGATRNEELGDITISV